MPSSPEPRRPFPRSRKVRKHSDFQRIQAPSARAGRATTAHFVFLVAWSNAALTDCGRGDAPPRDPSPVTPSRLGLVVTKKIGSAVERNRVKRVCRECFRLWPDFVPPGIDLIVIARLGAPQLGLAQVKAEWTQAAPSLGHRVREVLARGAPQPHVAPRRTVTAGNKAEGERNPA